jgi:hypothetical protein
VTAPVVMAIVIRAAVPDCQLIRLLIYDISNDMDRFDDVG